MRFSFNTISRQLFFAFGFLLAGITIIYVLALAFFSKLEATHQIENLVMDHQVLILRLMNTDQDYLRFETINDEYFRTGQSKYLRTRDSLLQCIERNFFKLERGFEEVHLSARDELKTTKASTNEYNIIFDTLKYAIETRGFRDYGLEGEMRTFAHQLEHDKTIALADLLMLRRHEKDYLLRRDQKYIHALNSLCTKIGGRTINESSKTSLLNYQSHFNRLVEVMKAIGNNSKEGYTAEFSQKGEGLTSSLTLLSTRAKDESGRIVIKAGLTFSSIAIVTTMTCLAFVYWISLRLTRPVKKLSASITKLMENQGLNERDLESDEINEITNLWQSFITLIRKIRQQLSEIEEQSSTLKEQNDELKKVNGELDRFIYSAAHDLKSPLTSLDGLIHLAALEIDNPEHEHYFSRMHGSIDKMYEFIRSITDYARNKTQTLDIREIDLVNMINDITSSLTHLPNADKLNIEVVAEVSVVNTDKTRLEIVLRNIIANAFHYLDPSKSYSYLRIRIMRKGEFTRVEINDNGIGILRESLPLIFDMFYRGTEFSKGTGMGLYLVKESVKSLKGHITVKSVAGQWTSFELLIPSLDNKTTERKEIMMVEELV